MTALTRESIHPATTVGSVFLSVADLGRSVAYYTDAVGMRLLAQNASTATLGVGEDRPLLQLSEVPDARPWPRGGRSYTGLYHFAILLPTRADLGMWARHWLSLGNPLGHADHLVSEALYLEDPDGHGIEVYRDRPRGQWHWDEGRIRMGNAPIDLSGLVREAETGGQEFTGLPGGTRMGHVHLQVGDIEEAGQFYSQTLGFDVVAATPTALFVSAGGYHHHLGLNTWHSQGAGPAPQNVAQLRRFAICLPDENGRSELLQRLDRAGVPLSHQADGVELADPWQNRILIRSESG